MALTLICPAITPSRWVDALRDAAPELDIRIWPHDHPKEDVEMALTWYHPPGELNRYPNLGCISSMGAGVDHLLSDPDLPSGTPIVRLVDRLLVRDMSEYLTLAVLSHFREFDRYRKFQHRQEWHPLAPRDKKDFPVGIMGMGQLGSAAAIKLKGEGFPVFGWKNSPGLVPGIETFHGEAHLRDFLSKSRILVCLLPLTPATRHILNLDHFSQLPRGAYLINVGRGGHLKEEDLTEALDRGMLSGACLDVFGTEPLPGDHPFWGRPEIRITPHISSQTHPGSVVPQVLDNLDRLREGRPLLNPVDLKKGY
ncbi:MAG: glyoxylate/hydroxypyruvate reductase A [Desulfobacter sp.]|nr:MAG: glyoxylate/hydroxypyruvate reductase A [Desulfobacter sp.]